MKIGVEEWETSLALLRPGAGLKQEFEVRVKCPLPWNKDPHFDSDGDASWEANDEDYEVSISCDNDMAFDIQPAVKFSQEESNGRECLLLEFLLQLLNDSKYEDCIRDELYKNRSSRKIDSQ